MRVSNDYGGPKAGAAGGYESLAIDTPLGRWFVEKRFERTEGTGNFTQHDAGPPRRD
jgi:hypothetical protein